MKFGNRDAETPRSAPAKSSSSGDISAYFGEGTEIQGDIKFKQTVRVDGTIRATVESEGEIVLGPKGLIEGDINVNSMSVSGRVKGNIRVKNRLEVHPGGRVEGEVLMGRPGLVIHDGGIIEARVQMGTMKNEAPARREEREEREERRPEKKAAAAAGAV